MLEQDRPLEGPSRKEKRPNQWYVSCSKTQLYDKFC